MIKVEKDFHDIPSILTKETREDAFNKNKEASSYVDDKNRYKVGSVQKRLNKIYHLKCAYCEKKLLDSPKHIEHYRPKSIYYWLAYSWDNLLLSCGNCNSAKGNRFKTLNAQVTYSNETFTSIHNLWTSYNIREKPTIINPEQEDVLTSIVFDKNAHMRSANTRVQYTIEDACKLNRDELIQLRLKVVTDFINRMNEHFLYFIKYQDITRFIPDIKNFKASCKEEKEFYAFRYFVIKNIEIFFEDDLDLQIIMKKLFARVT